MLPHSGRSRTARCKGEQDPARLTCTDCHGRHRLEKRKVRWNKLSGQLIGEETNSTPIVHGDIFIRTWKALWCFAAE